MSSPARPSTPAHTAMRSACSCSSARRWRSASARAASSAARRWRTTSEALSKSAWMLSWMSASASSSTHATRPAAYASRSCVKSLIADSAVIWVTRSRAVCWSASLNAGPVSAAAAGAGSLALSSVRAFFCAALARAFWLMSVSVSSRRRRQAIDRRHRGVGVLAAQRDAFDLGRVGQPFDRQQPRAALGGVTGNAAQRLLVAHRGNGRAAHGFGTGGLGHGRQLALAAERRQRGHGRRRDRGVVLRGLLDQLADARDRARSPPIRCGRCRPARPHRRCATPPPASPAHRHRPWRSR